VNLSQFRNHGTKSVETHNSTFFPLHQEQEARERERERERERQRCLEPWEQETSSPSPWVPGIITMEGEHHHDERAPWGRNPMV
jgi:hypothetical protein